MKPPWIIAAILGAVAVVFALLWLNGRNEATDLNAAWRAAAQRDSTLTASLIAQRDSLIVALGDSALALERSRKLRRPVYLRVDGAIHTLTGAPVDSLFSILDRPLPER